MSIRTADAINAAGIGVVVVTYQSAETIDDCLRRLRRSDGAGAIRVVDNGSTDGTVEIVHRHAAADGRVRFIANPDNPGFGTACNQGAHDITGAAWLAFVNPDCLVERDTLSRMQALGEPLGDALLGADLVDEDGRRDTAARRRDPDFAGMLAGALQPAKAASKLGVAVDEHLPLQPVDAVSGALMLVRTGLFWRLHGFDQAYRLHAEDLDLCRRAREAGAVVAVANEVRVVHVRGVSSRSRPIFVEWHKHRGLWRYFRKFEALQRTFPTRLAVFSAIWLRFPLAVLRAWRRR